MIGIDHVWAILNKVHSLKVESIMITELNNRLVKAIGKVSQYPEILKSGLEGTSIGNCKATDEVKQIICRLENAI